MAHVRHSDLDSGLGFQAKVRKMFQVVRSKEDQLVDALVRGEESVAAAPTQQGS